MKKEDVELVLLKSFDYWKSVICNEIDIGELQGLSEFIWESIKEKQELDAEIKRIYTISRKTLSKLITQGEHKFKDISGNSIILKFIDGEEPPCLLESGAVLLWHDKKKECRNKNKRSQDNGRKSEIKQVDRMLQKASKKRNYRKIKIEFDLNDISVDEFRPIIDQPILKVLYDIKQVQLLIVDKIAKDNGTSYPFKNLSYEELYKKVDMWATRGYV